MALHGYQFTMKEDKFINDVLVMNSILKGVDTSKGKVYFMDSPQSLSVQRNRTVIAKSVMMDVRADADIPSFIVEFCNTMFKEGKEEIYLLGYRFNLISDIDAKLIIRYGL